MRQLPVAEHGLRLRAAGARIARTGRWAAAPGHLVVVDGDAIAQRDGGVVESQRYEW